MHLSVRGLTSLGLLTFAFLANGADTKIVPLSEARKQLVLPKYTVAERQTLASQADFMIRNLYVHRDIKLKDFGPGVDPLPKLATLKDKAKDLTDEEVHSTLRNTFLDLHDLHTNYFAPVPLACGAAFHPLRFEAVKDGNEEILVVARKLTTKPELSKDFEIGDRVLEIDGEKVEDAIATLAKHSGGANPDAMKVRAIQMLSLRNLRSQAAPAKDVIKFKIKRGTETLEKEIPWQALVDEDCLEVANRANKPIINFFMAEDEYQKKFNRIFGQPTLAEPEESWAGENPFKDIFEFASLATPAGKMGYIRLKSFHWTDRRLDLGTVVEGFRRTLESSLGDAVGIIIDVRGNPGGHIVFAEKLVQLFSSKEVQPTLVRMLANELNEKIFVRANGKENRWSRSVRDAIDAKQPYIKPMAITPASEANSIGQVWFRPVVMLTDASCFSACDLFTAGMQDSGSGVVIGLHKTTGGGGANVMEYNTFRAIMGFLDNPFEALPHNQNMRVSWRQSIRSGKNAGVLIENRGVESEVVVPLKLSDLKTESKELMGEIQRLIGKMLPNYQSSVGIRRAGLVLLENDEPAVWKETLQGVDSVDVYVDSKKLATIAVDPSTEKKEVEIKVADLKGAWLDQRVVLQGKRSGKQVFRVVRELTWRGNYTEIPADGINVDFSEDDIDPFHAVLLKGNVGTGWRVVNGLLRIGKGPNYDSRVLARAFLPLQLDGKGGKVELDLALSAEELNDALRIYALNPDTGERVNYFAGSKFSGGRARLPLPKEWKRADVIFEFESDENWNLEGPRIDNVKVIR